MTKKIAFIGNTTSISYLVGRELLDRGYNVEVIDHPNLFRTNHLAPKEVNKPKPTSIFGRAMAKAQREFKKVTAEYDIEVRAFSGTQVKAKHRTIIYHGNDLRDDLWKHWDTGIHYPCFYSTVDLGLRYLEQSKLGTEAIWLPRTFVQEYFSPADRLPFDGENLTVGFFPTDPKMEAKGWQGKGTQLLYDAIEVLRNRGYNVTLLTPEITGFKAHTDMPKMYQQCHVIADQFHPNVGMYGVISLEAILMNRPPVCHVRDAHFEYDEMKHQITNCESDPESIADALIKAVDQKVDQELIKNLYSPKRTADVMEKAFRSWGFLN